MSKKVQKLKTLLIEKLEKQTPALFQELVEAKQEDVPDIFSGVLWENFSAAVRETVYSGVRMYAQSLIEDKEKDIAPLFPELWIFIKDRNQFLRDLPGILKSYPKVINSGHVGRAWEKDIKKFDSPDTYASHLKTTVKEYSHLIPKLKSRHLKDFVPYFRLLQRHLYLHMALHCQITSQHDPLAWMKKFDDVLPLKSSSTAIEEAEKTLHYWRLLIEIALNTKRGKMEHAKQLWESFQNNVQQHPDLQISIADEIQNLGGRNQAIIALRLIMPLLKESQSVACFYLLSQICTTLGDKACHELSMNIAADLTEDWEKLSEDELFNFYCDHTWYVDDRNTAQRLAKTLQRSYLQLQKDFTHSHQHASRVYLTNYAEALIRLGGQHAAVVPSMLRAAHNTRDASQPNWHLITVLMKWHLARGEFIEAMLRFSEILDAGAVSESSIAWSELISTLAEKKDFINLRELCEKTPKILLPEYEKDRMLLVYHLLQNQYPCPRLDKGSLEEGYAEIEEKLSMQDSVLDQIIQQSLTTLFNYVEHWPTLVALLVQRGEYQQAYAWYQKVEKNWFEVTGEPMPVSEYPLLSEAGHLLNLTPLTPDQDARLDHLIAELKKNYSDLPEASLLGLRHALRRGMDQEFVRLLNNAKSQWPEWSATRLREINYQHRLMQIQRQAQAEEKIVSPSMEAVREASPVAHGVPDFSAPIKKKKPRRKQTKWKAKASASETTEVTNNTPSIEDKEAEWTQVISARARKAERQRRVVMNKTLLSVPKIPLVSNVVAVDNSSLEEKKVVWPVLKKTNAERELEVLLGKLESESEKYAHSPDAMDNTLIKLLDKISLLVMQVGRTPQDDSAIESYLKRGLRLCDGLILPKFSEANRLDIRVRHCMAYVLEALAFTHRFSIAMTANPAKRRDLEMEQLKYLDDAIYQYQLLGINCVDLELAYEALNECESLRWARILCGLNIAYELLSPTNAEEEIMRANVLGGCLSCLEGIRTRYRLSYQTCLWAEDVYEKLRFFFNPNAPVECQTWIQKLAWPENAKQLLDEILDNYPECLSLGVLQASVQTSALAHQVLKAPPAWLGFVSGQSMQSNRENLQETPNYAAVCARGQF